MAKEIRIAENIKALSKRDGKTVKQVCEDVGYAVSCIYNWASRGHMPKLDVVCDFADYFGVSLDDIVYKDFGSN